MGIVAKHTILSDVTVGQAMRRQVVCLPREANINRCISLLVKYKVNAVMIVDADERPEGVVSKTDIMGAYYAGLPVQSPVSDIMMTPPLFCRSEDTLDRALEQMREHRVFRLYVRDRDSDAVAGVIAYPDVVGLLYQYCHECRCSRARKQADNAADSGQVRFLVREVMTSGVLWLPDKAPLTTIMEELSAYRLGAVLITGPDNAPAGVVSMSDLVLAYKHGVDVTAPAATVMSGPVHTCCRDDLLESAIRTLIFSQVGRIFVHQDDPRNIVGVLSLTDAARVRSGSCHACVCSRIRVEQDSAGPC